MFFFFYVESIVGKGMKFYFEFSFIYEGVTKSFRTGRLERELHMVQLSAIRCSCIVIVSVSLVSFAAITLCVASQGVFIFVVIHFVIDSFRKLLDTPSQITSYILLIRPKN
jgi:hypothetical protein